MMGWVHWITRQISDLNGESLLKEVSLSQLKKVTEILVIDDNEFTYLEALKKSDYHISQGCCGI